MRKKLFMAIDGYSLMYRAFYAMPNLTAPDGRPTGGITGFLNMLLKVMETYNPDGIAVAFDVKGPTFRHVAYTEYKATRKPTPPELQEQFPVVHELLHHMGIPVISVQGFEGDDVLGTLSYRAGKAGWDALLITGDRDALQLVSESTKVLLTVRGVTETVLFDKVALHERYGLAPWQVPELKGLMGDNADNIPGVPGVGEKTALNLLKEYHTIENLLSHTEELKGKLKEKIETGADFARISRELATIRKDVPIEYEWSAFTFEKRGDTALFDSLRNLGMRSVAERLKKLGYSSGRQLKPVDRLPEPIALNTVTALEQHCVRNTEVLVLLDGSILSIWDGKNLYALRMEGNLVDPGLPPEKAYPLIVKWMSRAERVIIHDAMTWMQRLDEVSCQLPREIFDTRIAGYLLDAVSGNYTPVEMIQCTLHRNIEAPTAYDLYNLAEAQEKQLQKEDMLYLYREIELPLTRLLFSMQRTGFKVDTAVLQELGQEMEHQIHVHTQNIYSMAGGPFNIQSPKQLGDVLYGKLGLPVLKKNKTGPSTDVSVLERLAEKNSIIPEVLTYRTLTKLKSTFIDGLLQEVKNGRVHTRFNQTGTATGRLSSAEPNLQNIPIRLPEGRMIRKAFVASDTQHVLVDGDYSQIELRILAHMSGDEKMIEAFHSGADIHTKTAGEVFDTPMEKVTQIQRSAAKAVNFGIIYGISDFGLAKQLGISRKKAAEHINKYLSTYPGVKAYMERTVEEGREKGYTETLYHRRRPMLELRSSNHNIRAAAERMAMNAPIQGTAADVMKLAMVRTEKALRRAGLSAQILLQVHDELLIDCPISEKDQVSSILREAMEGAAALAVPLKVDIGSAYSWYDTK
ncbi:MAG: DNA polymerase I [Christensenellales bacterium]|jgi:DNA polymerase-1